MMLSTGLAISSEQAEHLLERWLGVPVQCERVARLSGGMINSVLRLEFDHAPYRAVVKMNPDGDFRGEERRLDYLREHSRMRCPAVYAIGDPDDVVPCRSLLLECLPGTPLTSVMLEDEAQRRIDEQLAETLLELHTHTRATFGPIGDGPGTDTWAAIAVPRLQDMRGEVQGRLPASALVDIDRAVEAAPTVFRDQGRPTLIHGDLWAGNIMVARCNGSWQVTGFIDPGAQYADVEHELAYLQCFRTVGPTFAKVYTAGSGLRPGFEFRRLYYWLNTMMIHVWLFGDAHYCRRAGTLAAEICRRLGDGSV